MRIDRWALDPLRVVPLLFGVQLVVWYFGMPQLPMIPGTAPRYVGVIAPFRYLVIVAFLLLGLVLSRALSRRLGAVDRPYDPGVARRLLGLRRYAILAVLVSLAGEAIYIRGVLGDPGRILRAFYLGAFASVGEEAGAARVVGLSSLNNLFVVPTAIYALIAFHRDVPAAERRRARLFLALTGLAVVAHGMVLSARMFVLYYAMITLAAYLVARGRHMVVPAWRVAASVAGFAVIVWAGETIRGGLPYALANDVAVTSPQAQRYVRDRLTQAYIASDVNNALTLLECRPAMQIAATTALRGLLARPLAYEERCQRWQSAYGTVNITGLWWFDAGWFAVVFAFLLGCWLGLLYAIVTAGRTGVGTLLFLVSYPGFYAISRVNFFGLTIFILPALFLLAVATWQWLFAHVIVPALYPRSGTSTHSP